MPNMQVTAYFYQERGKDIHTVVTVDRFEGTEYIETEKKICLNLERLPLNPQLLHYELTNGFPSFSPFDPKYFGGYTYDEVMDQLENSVWQEIAYFYLDDDIDQICCQYDLMNEETRKLIQETLRIFEEEARIAGKKYDGSVIKKLLGRQIRLF